MPTTQERLRQLEQLKTEGLITDDEYQAKRTEVLEQAVISTEARPQSRGGGIFKWGLFGCLAIFAGIGILVIGLIAIIAIAVGGGADSLSELEDTRVALQSGASGTVETAGDVKNKVTINRITDPAISDNEFEQPSPGNHYITFALTIENVGDRETTGGDFTLRTIDGFEYDVTFVSGVGATDLNFLLQGLTSGGKTDSVIAFEVRDGSVIEWLKFDPNPFAKGDLYFDN